MTNEPVELSESPNDAQQRIITYKKIVTYLQISTKLHLEAIETHERGNFEVANKKAIEAQEKLAFAAYESKKIKNLQGLYNGRL